MNVWIFQDQRGIEFATTYREDEIITWNIDRYLKVSTVPHIEKDDIVLWWQPQTQNSPPGIYAY